MRSKISIILLFIMIATLSIAYFIKPKESMIINKINPSNNQQIEIDTNTTFHDLKNKKYNFTKKNLKIFIHWASWCIFCKEDILFALQYQSKKNIKFFLISHDDKQELLTYLKKNKISIPIIFLKEQNETFKSSFKKVESLPSSIIIKDNKIISIINKNIGTVTSIKELEELL